MHISILLNPRGQRDTSATPARQKRQNHAPLKKKSCKIKKISQTKKSARKIPLRPSTQPLPSPPRPGPRLTSPPPGPGKSPSAMSPSIWSPKTLPLPSRKASPSFNFNPIPRRPDRNRNLEPAPYRLEPTNSDSSSTPATPSFRPRSPTLVSGLPRSFSRLRSVFPRFPRPRSVSGPSFHLPPGFTPEMTANLFSRALPSGCGAHPPQSPPPDQNTASQPEPPRPAKKGFWPKFRRFRQTYPVP